jgi:hypothetical protein
MITSEPAGSQILETARSSQAQLICASAIAALAWIGLGAEMVLSVQDAVAKNLSVATQLLDQFSRFSMQTTAIVALVTTFAVVRPQAKFFLLRPNVQAALVVYAVVVGTVFEVMLRPDSQSIQIVDSILHGFIPILYLSYWLIFVPKGTLSSTDPILWLIYPIIFFAYTMIRGVIFGVYLRHFQEIIKLGGYQFLIHTLVFFTAFLAVGFVLVLVDQELGRRRNRRRTEWRSAIES